MHHERKPTVCPDCGDPVSRRAFVKTAAVAAVAAAATKTPVWASTWREEKPESLVRMFHRSLRPEQRKEICLRWDDPRRKQVSNSWDVVPQQIGKFYSGDQQQMLRDIFRGLLTEDGRGRFARSMKDDYGGFESYHVAVFGDPAADKWEWLLTGRHVTLRCSSADDAAFGGPMFYGHAAESFVEKADHPGNVFWRQAILANKVFTALDGKQQAKALLPNSPSDDDSSIVIKKTGPWNGLRVGDLSRDQKSLVEETVKDLLAPYRGSDVAQAMQLITAAGGLDQVHLAFYRDGDLGDDHVWDRWKLESPTMSWYFRGSPHVHTWVHIAKT